MRLCTAPLFADYRTTLCMCFAPGLCAEWALVSERNSLTCAQVWLHGSESDSAAVPTVFSMITPEVRAACARERACGHLHSRCWRVRVSLCAHEMRAVPPRRRSTRLETAHYVSG